MGNHNFVAKKPVTRVRKPRVVSSQNKQNKTLREQYFFYGKKITGRVVHVHLSAFQVTTFLSLSFQNLPAKMLMLVYRE